MVDESKTSYSFGATFEREMTRVLNARTSLTFGRMKGTQTGDYNDQELAYASFENMYAQFDAGVSLRLMDLAFGYFKQRAFSPYVIGQVGIAYFNATEKYGPLAEIYPMGNAVDGPVVAGNVWRESSGVTPVLSIGGGLSYWLSPRFSIRGEILANQPFSDEMDAHTEFHFSDGTLKESNGVDFYYTATLGLSYTIKDNRWRNEPKYNRKTYVKMRRYNMSGGGNRSKFKVNRNRR